MSLTPEVRLKAGTFNKPMSGGPMTKSSSSAGSIGPLNSRLGPMQKNVKKSGTGNSGGMRKDFTMDSDMSINR